MSKERSLFSIVCSRLLFDSMEDSPNSPAEADTPSRTEKHRESALVDNPWTLKKWDEVKRQEIRFKWKVASLQALAYAQNLKNSEQDGSSSNGRYSKKTSANNLDHIIGAAGSNLQGMKEHMLLRSMLKPGLERSEEDIDLLQVRL